MNRYFYSQDTIYSSLEHYLLTKPTSNTSYLHAIEFEGTLEEAQESYDDAPYKIEWLEYHSL